MNLLNLFSRQNMSVLLQLFLSVSRQGNFSVFFLHMLYFFLVGIVVISNTGFEKIIVTEKIVITYWGVGAGGFLALKLLPCLPLHYWRPWKPSVHQSTCQLFEDIHMGSHIGLEQLPDSSSLNQKHLGKKKKKKPLNSVQCFLH